MKKYSGFLKILVLLLFLPFCIWRFAVSNTMEIKKKHKILRHIIPDTNSGDLPFAIKEISPPFISSGGILDSIAECILQEKVNVVSYTPVLTDMEEDCALYSGLLKLSGRYTGLVKTIDRIEHMQARLKIISVNFYMYPPYTIPSKQELRVDIAIQQIEYK